MQGQWFYGTANQRLGPVSLGELQRLFADGKVQPQTLVWVEGMPQWVPAGSLPVVVNGSTTNSAGLNLLLPIGPQSGFAIAAGYLGLIGLLFAPAGLLGILFGILAIRDLKAHPEKRGMGRAITGIVCGALGCLALVLILTMSRGH